ncbi:uncharacterized protein LOC122371407 isoform X2 [Amphibalanus amphitrite]|uniref:uncharacterized protein LOC122366521 isoform X2 n=1 Tax=Amphibalanus amphitrite TaxID=1232801 RepID=UPI001C900A25|nr:uncharacterized protein LOC122366521 isoform X2 [Amphibalanus amphitrite]XP_043203643.1 uncharacterized protein LOC122371407 isoform X2 [Amphibalanus amphitrite]
MNRTLYAVGVLLLAAAAQASDVANVYDEADSRFLFDENATTSLAVSFSSLAAGLLALLVVGLLMAVLSFFLFGSAEETGYATAGSSYSSYGSARAASASDPYSAVFDKLSILDWIAMMEEVYRNFDATKMECQQRIVCELHQNENTWGTTARKMNDAFSYLQYLELLNLPSEMRMLLDEYMDAANKGRTSQKTCEEMFSGCQFSIKNLITKYNGSNAI